MKKQLTVAAIIVIAFGAYTAYKHYSTQTPEAPATVQAPAETVETTPVVVPVSAPVSDVKYLTILHTNDTHGHFYRDKNGQAGFSAQKTIVDAIKKEIEAKGGEVLILNAGDFNTGVPESDLQNAEPDLIGFNNIKYDALVLGNHEFDAPISQLENQMKVANFPFLSANIFKKADGSNYVAPYKIFEKAGLKIAVVGFTTEDTPNVTNPVNTKDLDFRSPIEVAKELLPKIKEKEKQDITIALTHMGYYPNANHGSNAPGDVSLARALPAGSLDLIVGGHSHTAICLDDQGKSVGKINFDTKCLPDIQNGTTIVQAGRWGQYLGREDYEYKDGKLTLLNYQLVPVNLKSRTKNSEGKTVYVDRGPQVQEEPQVLEILTKFQDVGDDKLGVKIAELVGDLKSSRGEQNELGYLIAFAQQQRVNADIGIMNSGGIRSSMNGGDITYRDILLVQPFANVLATITLKGEDFINYITKVALRSPGSGGFAQWSGIGMTVDVGNEKVSDVMINNEPYDPNREYKIALSSFLASGGDNYPVVDKLPSFVNTGFIDADALKEFFENNSPVKASDFPKNDQIKFINIPAPKA